MENISNNPIYYSHLALRKYKYWYIYNIKINFKKKELGVGEEREKVTVDCKENIQIFSKTIDVVEKGETVLENGDNEYPFSMTLPEDLQSSFFTKFGGFMKVDPFANEHGTWNIIIQIA